MDKWKYKVGDKLFWEGEGNTIFTVIARIRNDGDDYYNIKWFSELENKIVDIGMSKFNTEKHAYIATETGQILYGEF